MSTGASKCYFCQKKIDDESKICPNCGQDQRRNFYYYIILGATVLFLTIGAFTLSSGGPSIPTFAKKTVESKQPESSNKKSVKKGNKLKKLSKEQIESYYALNSMAGTEIEYFKAGIPEDMSEGEYILALLRNFNGYTDDEIVQFLDMTPEEYANQMMNAFFGDGTEDTEVADMVIDNAVDSAESFLGAFGEALSEYAEESSGSEGGIDDDILLLQFLGKETEQGTKDKQRKILVAILESAGIEDSPERDEIVDLNMALAPQDVLNNLITYRETSTKEQINLSIKLYSLKMGIKERDGKAIYEVYQEYLKEDITESESYELESKLIRIAKKYI